MGSQENHSNKSLDYRGTLQTVFHEIVIPQLYVILGCILIGAFRAENELNILYWVPQLDFKILILYFFISFLIFVIYYFGLFVSSHASILFFSLEIIVLSAALFIGALLLNIHYASVLFFPITFLTYPIIWYLRGGISAIRCVAPNFFVLAGFGLLNLVTQPESSIAAGYAVGLAMHFLGVMGFIVVNSLIIKRQQAVTLDGSNLEEGLESKEFSFLRAVTGPIGRDFVAKFLPISIVVSLATIVLGIFHEAVSINYFAVWFSILCLQILIFTQVARENNLNTIYLFWIIQFGLLSTLWWQALLAGVVVYETVEVALLMLVLTLGGMPWHGRFNLTFGAILLVITTFLMPSSSTPVILGALMLFLILFLTRQSAKKFIISTSSSVYPQLVPRARGCTSINDVAQLLAEVMHVCFDAAGAIVIKGDAQAFFRGFGSPEFHPQDKPVLAGIFQALKLLPHQLGMIPTTTLDRQLLPSLYGWFGYLPQRLIYFKVELKAVYANELLIGVLPAGVTARMVDTETLKESLGQIISLTKISIDSSRKSGRGTHIFISPVREIGGIGEDVSEIIHSVNNSTQEITRVVESLKLSSSEIARSSAIVSERELNLKAQGILKGLEYLEFGARNIAMSASDAKWLREASYAQRPDSYEAINFDELFEDLQKYLSYRQSKGAIYLTEFIPIKTDALIYVANRELLEACLRGVVRVLSRGRSLEQLKLSHTVDETFIGVAFSFTGGKFKSIEEVFKARKDEEVLKSLQNFMFISDGEVRFSANVVTDEQAELILRFPKRVQKESLVENLSSWALLVDDKPEIVNFYSSVAEALALPHGIANTLAEARALLKSRGEPGIVVTDIQLDQENGLELVKEIRESYGAAVPIIVVSGNIEENIRTQVFAAGASRYLTKPVGRKKLFLEIQELLHES